MIRPYAKSKLIAVFVCLCGSIALNEVTAQTRNNISVVKAVAPLYPPFSIAVRDMGVVMADVSVNQNGFVDTVKLGSAPKLLQKVVEIAARKWVFEKDGAQRPIRKIRLSFIFRIVSGDAPPDELLTTFKPPYEVVITAKPPLVTSLNSHRQ